MHEVTYFIEGYLDLAGELLNHFGDNINDARKAIEENYSGYHKSLADYTKELTENANQIPENLAYYIDYEYMWRDMELNGDVCTAETGFEEVHVF